MASAEPATPPAPNFQALYMAEFFHGMADSIAKLASPMFVYEAFGNDTLYVPRPHCNPMQPSGLNPAPAAPSDDRRGAARFLALINTTCSFNEFILNPALGQISDAYGRMPFLVLWPVANFITRIGVAVVPLSQTTTMYFAQQVTVKMIEYTFDKARPCHWVAS